MGLFSPSSSNIAEKILHQNIENAKKIILQNAKKSPVASSSLYTAIEMLEENEIIIFPSKIKHSTNLNITEKPRISISGDVTVMLKDSYKHERLMPHFENWQAF